MATVTGVIRYHVAGLPASALLSAVEIEATVQRVSFGRVEGMAGVNLGPAGETLHQWWAADVAEPSFAADFAVTLTEAPVAKIGLLESDITLTRATAVVASVRALAERTQIKLPSLERTAVVGMIESDGKLSCPPSVKTREIALVLASVGCQRLIGPFSTTDPALQGLEIKPAHNLLDLLRLTLGDDPVAVMRLALEWLMFSDPEVQGAEIDLWHEAERRVAENLSSLVSWFDNEVKQRPPRSQVIQAALVALKSLARFQADGNSEALERICSQLETTGSHLTAVWLLTRWSFLLREQRHDEEADRCLQRADEMQKRLPLTQPVLTFLHQIGRAHYYRARFSAALQSYWTGHSFLERTTGRDELRTDFYNSAGKCFNDTYQFAMALELFERARQIRARLRQDKTLARSWGAMGEVYWRVGDLDEAERCFRQNVELSQRTEHGRNEHRDEMRAKNYLANVLFAKGAWNEANTLYRETETYYRARFDEGNTNEFGNLAYSVEGLARTAAARNDWHEVARLEETHAALARNLLKPDEPAILPMALLAYLNALRCQHEGDTVGALTRLNEAETMLTPLYPAERAMVVIEIIISEMTPYRNMVVRGNPQRLEAASSSLSSILQIMEKPEVVACFAPIRRELEQGKGELGKKGQELFARDRQRHQELSSRFVAARTCLVADYRDEAIDTLRQIQESVVFFRDILKHIAM
jgi:tetratricopeptide (TPR) repeat protein